MTVATAVPVVRDAVPPDRDRIIEIVRATALFRPDEVEIAAEVVDGMLDGSRGEARVGPYDGAVADIDGRLAGWIAWGPTPCTIGTYDMYWLVVDPAAQGQGVGTTLVREMERRLAGTARLIVVETAGRSDYAATRAFYESRGYRRTATIPDFYAPDDDLVVYVKALTTLAR